MKHQFILFFLLLFTSTLSFSQEKDKQFAIYSTLGAKATIGASAIKNAHMISDVNLSYKSTPKYCMGIKTSINYIGKEHINLIYGIHIDYLWGKHSLEFTEIQTREGPYYKKVDFNTTDLTITFRRTNVSGKWFLEAGSQFSGFLSISQINKGISQKNTSYFASYNYPDNYKNYTSFVLGVGVFIKGVVVSTRSNIGITSITKTGSNPVKDGFYNQNLINSSYKTQYKTDKSTRHHTFQICIEYYLPFIKFKRDSRGRQKISIFKKINPSYYWGPSLD